MASQPSFLFAVKPEQYACLTIESLMSLNPNTGASRTLDQPPLKQPIVDPAAKGVFTHPWQYWINKLSKFLAGDGSSQGNLIEFIAPSVDETDIGWHGIGTIDASTDPVTFSAAINGASRFGMTAYVENGGKNYTSATAVVKDKNGATNGAAITLHVSNGAIVDPVVTATGWGLVPPLTVTVTGDGTGADVRAIIGRQFNAGDYILWNDEYSYEIDQIKTISYSDANTASITLQRAANGAPAGMAQFLSPMAAHLNRNFWRLIPGVFHTRLDPSITTPQIRRFVWDNMTVCAVQGQFADDAAIIQNLGPRVNLSDDTRTPPCPGIRTMQGAAYISFGIAGTLTQGQVTNIAPAAQAWESIRCLYARLGTAPTGGTVTIYVCWINDIAGTIGLVDVLTIAAGDTKSFAGTNPPDGRFMPYFAGSARAVPTSIGTYWPPEIMPAVSNSLPLTLPISQNAGSPVIWRPDGYLQGIVDLGGATGAADLDLVMQT